MSGGFLEFEGADPNGEGKQTFRVSREYLRQLQRFGPTQKYYDVTLVPEVVQEPTVIFCGLERTNYEDALCYCGKPRKRWQSDTIELPPPKGMVFVVTVDRNFSVIDWAFRKSDPLKGDFPLNFQEDFGHQVWPRHPQV